MKNVIFKLVKGYKVSIELKDNYENEGIYYYEVNSNQKYFI